MHFPAFWLFLMSSSVVCKSSASALDDDNLSIRAAKADPICGTLIQPPTAVAASEARARRMQHQYTRRVDNASVVLPIDVYMQVLSGDGSEEEGNIPDATIVAQIKVLNEAFRAVGFEFRVVDTIRTVNESWYHNLKPASATEREVSKIRKGDIATLNIYTMGALNTTTQAWATVPSELAYYDGVTINGTVFLGGSNPEFDLGDTLVHEVGHWTGLYHTFAFGCEKSYDYVDDTPIEDQPPISGGCDVGRDTCPDQPGLDLVHNYMSYSNDECRDSWTPGQIQRMREQMAKFRGVVYPGIVVGDIPDDD